MFKTLFEKELKAILLSPKFVATFGVCTVLILLSVFIGIKEYEAGRAHYETAVQLTQQNMLEASNWWSVTNRVFREPDPMQVFVSGVNNDIGRLSDVSTWNEIKLKQSSYSDDPLFALFRFIDFTFIVQVVLSLFAILFTYDAINGERESGTLKLALSNAVPRSQYVLAKFAGSWIGLVVPILIPILIASLLVIVLGIPFETVHWYKFVALVGVSILYFSFFIALGILVSALTRHSNISFLILLVMWVVIVLIVPRAATMVAGQIKPVTSIAEIESQKDRHSTDQWSAYSTQRRGIWDERMAATKGMSKEDRDIYLANNRERWVTEDGESRQTVMDQIADYERQLNEDLRNQKADQERLAFNLSRISPSSAYQLAAMNLAGTHTSLKQRYETSMEAYRTSFSEFVNEQRKKEQLARMRPGNNRNAEPERLDLKDLPRYQAPDHTFAEAVSPSIFDFGLLGIFSVVAFAGAFLSFLRYDVR